MLKLPILFSLLVCSASAISPSDVFNLLQQPQVASMAKDYVVNTMAGPLSELRNSICSSPLLNEDKMAGTLTRAADTVASAFSETANIVPQLQDAMSYMTQISKDVMSDPSFKPHMEALQKQLESTLDYLGDHLDVAVDAVSKIANKEIR